jgi:hypothetical protein
MHLTISSATSPTLTLPNTHRHQAASTPASVENGSPASVVSLTPTTQGNYDFTQMTPQQMQSTMNKLIQSGKLSLDASTALIGLIPTPLSKPIYDGQTPATYSQPMNFIAALQSGLGGAQMRGDEGGAAAISKALTALQNLQGTNTAS